MLERKMMFLNEPSVMEAQMRQGVDQVKQMWSVHGKQMSYHDESLQGEKKPESFETKNAVDKHNIDELLIGKPPGFSAPGERPKDFDRF